MEKGRRVAGRGGGGGEGMDEGHLRPPSWRTRLSQGLAARRRVRVWRVPNFVFGLGSYREDVNFLRIIMDEAHKPSAAAH